jgi:hypothetical protein
MLAAACLTTNGNTEQLVFLLDLARRDGYTEEELKKGSLTLPSTPVGRGPWLRWPSRRRVFSQ